MAYIEEYQFSLFDDPEPEETGITDYEVDEVLRLGPPTTRSKLRVWRYFKENHTKDDRTKFIMDEWGTGGQCPAYWKAGREKEISTDYGYKGFRLRRNVKPGEERLLSWNQVESRIMEMVTSETWMTDKDLKHPCVNCIFEKDGYCKHIDGDTWWCEPWHKEGCFQIPRDWKCRCGRTPKLEDIQQDEMGSDSYHCRCGVVTIFNNQGERPSAMELWKKGELIGT